ncbi:Replication factor C subunit 3 [Chionoecetes opilio]|uniref:Replication factor C subunit 3 n=1 Tax=Chionoecetes opilio TaxID=41210 RepID=A0A8J8WCJ3_CHIOP|nr:Replication factor C subunit 3 [Chionoecetes opilio]
MIRGQCCGVQTVCRKEGLMLPPELATRMAEASNRNLRRALLLCEATKVNQYPFSKQQELVTPDWEVYLRDTAAKIVDEQSPKCLLEVRERFYELLTHCIPSETIFKGLLQELVKDCDGELKCEVTRLAAHHEHRLNLGSKAIYHIEAFVAAFMALYKKYLEESMGDICTWWHVTQLVLRQSLRQPTRVTTAEQDGEATVSSQTPGPTPSRGVWLPQQQYRGEIYNAWLATATAHDGRRATNNAQCRASRCSPPAGPHAAPPPDGIILVYIFARPGSIAAMGRRQTQQCGTTLAPSPSGPLCPRRGAHSCLRDSESRGPSAPHPVGLDIPSTT